MPGHISTASVVVVPDSVVVRLENIFTRGHSENGNNNPVESELEKDRQFSYNLTSPPVSSACLTSVLYDFLFGDFGGAPNFRPVPLACLSIEPRLLEELLRVP